MKATRTIVIIIAVILLIPALGFLSWYLKKGSELEVFFVHKSMTDYAGTENKSFNWILNNRKILRPGRAPYHMKINFYGVQMNGNDYRNVYPRLKDLDRLVEKTGLFYYADVSGIPASKLGLLKEGGGVAVAALQELHVTPVTLRREIEARIPRGKGHIKLGDIPFTQAAKKALEYAVEFARHFHHNYIGTEHILLGILHVLAQLSLSVKAKGSGLKSSKVLYLYSFWVFFE